MQLLTGYMEVNQLRQKLVVENTCM